MTSWRRHLTEEDRAVLAAGGFAAPAWTGERPGLLVVDAQYGFVGLAAPILESVATYPTSVGERAWRAGAGIASLLALARTRGVAVVFAQSGVPPAEGGFDPFAAKVTAVRAPARPAPWPAYDLVAPLAPRPGEAVVRKRCASAFFGSPLASLLRHLCSAGCGSAPPGGAWWGRTAAASRPSSALAGPRISMFTSTRSCSTASTRARR